MTFSEGKGNKNGDFELPIRGGMEKEVKNWKIGVINIVMYLIRRLHQCDDICGILYRSR